MSLRAIVVGSSGQDGTLLTRLLSERGYEVVGLSRSALSDPAGIWGGGVVDITNPQAVVELLSRTRPNEVYFLAAHHHSSEDNQGDEGILFCASTEIHLMALVAFLEAIRRVAPDARLFYAASSHVFGTPREAPQDENTPINPETVYGITKAAGLFACRRYRKAHHIYASVGILFNHESYLRNARFVSKKITAGAAGVKRGIVERIVLGNLDASADWGYAPDYVNAMHRMLGLKEAGDFVLATGRAHTVREFAEAAFNYVGLDYRPYVQADETLIQRKLPGLVGSPARFMAASGWKPSLNFTEMVHTMVQQELDAVDGK